ncbi:TRAP-type C4-dicarboxylate transport system, substrate-binding protein [Anaerovirgula multivorans]|uniref:TRAP-type C4-dicarboxylate transport system, substrate-binding protein n=2 Tax=Anaerovirgula multivorans TaxID=312168 RepID=A0A239K1S5_9FIRM|nr:TRAP-type C4-dicarboxylate transport system, substrate-binding protein [Anaerovirgula multivorans]
MSEKIVLKGKRVVGGVAEGEALVTSEYISGWGGLEPSTGKIIDLRHELAGKSIAGKVLVFQGAKGSSGWSGAFHQARTNGFAPTAMIFNEMSTKIALGSVVTRCPAMTGLDEDPTKVIETGDWVRVDADNGLVEIIKNYQGGKEMLKKLLAFLMIIALMLSFVACSSGGDNDSNKGSSDEKPVKWVMTTIYTDPTGGDITYKSLGAAMEYFINRVNEKSEGRLTIEGFYGGVLGSANDTFQQMERNETQIYYGQPMSTINKAFGVWSIPFLFTDYEKIVEVACDPDGEFFQLSSSLFDPHNAILLANGVGNIRGLLNSKQQVGPIEDVRNLKIRTYEDEIVNSFWTNICNATPMGIGDVYTALQTNAVDGLEFSVDSIITRKYHEISKYYSDINWQWANGACFVVNRQAYENLPEDLQQIVSECAWEAANFQTEHSISDYNKALTILESEYGVSIHNLTDEERQTWIDYADSVADDMRQAVGAELYDNMKRLANK